MNHQEREQLNLFLQQLTQVQAAQKDAEAEGLIRDACARQIDASYLLVQRAMQLELALKAAHEQCVQLQAELDKRRSGNQSSFLNDAHAWGGSTAANTAVPAASPGSALQLPAQRAVLGPAPAASSWGSGILGTVATTAAGVVAGSFLFQGLGNLMGRHNEPGAGESKTNANAASPATDNSVIENSFAGDGTEQTVALAEEDNGVESDDAA